MTKGKTISGADLARHWEVSPGRVSQLKSSKDMPAFETLEAADAWRSVHAPSRRSKCLPPNGEDQSPEKIANKDTPPEPNQNKGAVHESALIDVSGFIDLERDFEIVMIESAEHAPQIAYGLYRRACESGNPVAISAANRNWHESAKASRAVRSDFLDLQEKTNSLISLDMVMDVVGTELQGFRSVLLKSGERWAIEANPKDPAKAQSAINRMVDDLLARLEVAATRVIKELPTEEPEAAAVVAS